MWDTEFVLLWLDPKGKVFVYVIMLFYSKLSRCTNCRDGREEGGFDRDRFRGCHIGFYFM